MQCLSYSAHTSYTCTCSKLDLCDKGITRGCLWPHHDWLEASDVMQDKVACFIWDCMAKISPDKWTVCSTVDCCVSLLDFGCDLSRLKVRRCHIQSSRLTRVGWPISPWCSRGALLSLCHTHMSSCHRSRRGRRGQRPLSCKGEQRINSASAKRLLSPHLHFRTSKLKHAKGVHAV